MTLFTSGHSPAGAARWLGAFLHPDHLAMRAFAEPLPQPLTRQRRGIGAGHAGRGETQR